jgi:hypothetical protein
MRVRTSDDYLVESCTHEFASARDYLCLYGTYVLKLIITFGDVLESLFEIGREGFLKESQMTGIDADNRGFRKAALMHETQECAVASDAGQQIDVLGILVGYLKAEFLKKRNESVISFSRLIFQIAEHVYLHFVNSVCYNISSEILMIF